MLPILFLICFGHLESFKAKRCYRYSVSRGRKYDCTELIKSLVNEGVDDCKWVCTITPKCRAFHYDLSMRLCDLFKHCNADKFHKNSNVNTYKKTSCANEILDSLPWSQSIRCFRV
ncbi:hypothetical protein GJ496_007755 [Pomphorhynchus laevis]|nr:hypothetical protein GJ496_007755 [Pomphorhynchus laevis]